MDKLGKLAYQNSELLYQYKGQVPTPPLLMVDDIQIISKCGSLETLSSNQKVNTFMHLKKLSLSYTKCHNIHIGKSGSKCDVLKIGDKIMQSSNQEKYLGDLVDQSGRIGPTIEARKSKGYGIISEILSILEEIPFGPNRVKAGLILRKARFLNGLLFNSESWHGVTMAHIIKLERLDNILLRGILGGAHSKTPVEFLYLECGTLLIRYIVASRRILYLHNILNRNKSDILYKYFITQKSDSLRGDFCRLVNSDIKLINLNMSEEEISNSSKHSLKRIIQVKCLSAAKLD